MASLPSEVSCLSLASSFNPESVTFVKLRPSEEPDMANLVS